MQQQSSLASRLRPIILAVGAATVLIGAGFAHLAQGDISRAYTKPYEPAEMIGTFHARIATSMGDIVVALDGDKAPISVQNFLQYAEDGHYDRTIFHRVVGGFVIQGGGYSQYLSERPTREPIAYEAHNGLKNERGTIAMARTSDPESATSQFYINLKDNPALDHSVTDLGARPGYTVFGRVIEGMDVADAIGAVETGPGGVFSSEVPVTPIVITRIDKIDAPAGSE